MKHYAPKICRYAPVKNDSYYAQNYAGIMCQGLAIIPYPHTRIVVHLCGSMNSELRTICYVVSLPCYACIISAFFSCIYKLCMVISELVDMTHPFFHIE